MSDLRVLYRDERVLAVDKPAGILSVPGRGAAAEAEGPALSLLVRALAPGALPVHRLDRDTSGVFVFALGREAHKKLNAAFEGRRAEKRYLALCEGDLAQAARCELPLIEGRAGGMHIARAEDAARAMDASTEFVPLERFGSATLVEARPRTGRMHQIRAHLAALGHALLVDPRYRSDGRASLTEALLDPLSAAPGAVALDRTPLHAAAIRVENPSGRGFLQIESPTPKDLARCLEILRAARRRQG